MFSKTSKIFLVTFFLSTRGFAVSDLNKVEELFKANKYKKAYKSARKLKGEPAYYKKPKTYFYMGFSMLNLSKEVSQKLGVSNRDKTIVFNDRSLSDATLFNDGP